METEKPISRLPGKNNDCIYPCIPCIEEVQIVQIVSDFVNCHHLECFLMLLVYIKNIKSCPMPYLFGKQKVYFTFTCQEYSQDQEQSKKYAEGIHQSRLTCNIFAAAGRRYPSPKRSVHEEGGSSVIGFQNSYVRHLLDVPQCYMVRTWKGIAWDGAQLLVYSLLHCSYHPEIEVYLKNGGFVP